MTIDLQTEQIRQAVEDYRRNPSRTSRLGLRRATCGDWLVLEQNPNRDSPYGRLRRAGIEVAHLIYQQEENDDLFAGYVIRDNIYLKPAALQQQFDPQILTETLAGYFEDMHSSTFAGVSVEFSPDPAGKALVFRLNGRDIHAGIRLDLIERLLL